MTKFIIEETDLGDINPVDSKGNTPYDFVRKSDNMEMKELAKYLKIMGSKTGIKPRESIKQSISYAKKGLYY